MVNTVCQLRNDDNPFVSKYAITIELDPQEGKNYIKCYFAGWMNNNLNINAVAKLVNKGSSYTTRIGTTTTYGFIYSTNVIVYDV